MAACQLATRYIAACHVAARYATLMRLTASMLHQ
jgi:hypothetical protein